MHYTWIEFFFCNVQALRHSASAVRRALLDRVFLVGHSTQCRGECGWDCSVVMEQGAVLWWSEFELVTLGAECCGAFVLCNLVQSGVVESALYGGADTK